MTATTASHHRPRSRSAPARWVVLLIALMLATGSALAALPASAQDATETAAATATPTQEELQDRLDRAIFDGVDQLELTFEEYNDSGVDGTATFYAIGEDETIVAIAIEGGGDRHPAFILEGTCGNTEPEPVERLTVVDDTGESLSLIERSLTDLIDGGDYTVDLRLSPNELGTIIVCANIEGTAVPATPAPGSTPPAETETPAVTPTGAGGTTGTETATETPETPTETATAAAETPTAAETATATATEAATTPTATETATTGEEQDGTGGAQVAPDSVASLPLTDYSGLGVSGTVSLIALDDDTTKVTITLTGDGVTGGHIAHLHPGTCANPQDEGTIYLATVGANGISETTVGLSLDDLLTGGWVINVHLSEAEWDTWLVCGELTAATGGMTGVIDVTPVIGGKGVAVGGKGTTTTTTTTTATTAAGGKGTTSTTAVGGKGTTTTAVGGDGTGVSGKGGQVPASTLTQGVGVGSTLPWPDSPAQAMAWSLAIFAAMLTGAGLMLRRGERTNRSPSRWPRLGL